MAGFGFGRGSELALERDRERRWIAAVVAALAFLATLALGLALALSGTAKRWQANFAGTLTVELPAGADPAVAAATQISRAAAEALLSPWLGAGNLEDLPIPVLIDVRLAAGAAPNLAALGARLEAAAPDAAIDDHGRWLGGFLALARAAGLVAAIVLAAVGLAAASCVAFATRAGLAMHREAVDLLHLVGAPDGYIAVQFARAAMRLAFAGAGLGAAGAALVLVAASAVASSSATLAFPLPALGWSDWLLLACVPFAATLVAAAAAYGTVMRNLARIL